MVTNGTTIVEQHGRGDLRHAEERGQRRRNAIEGARGEHDQQRRREPMRPKHGPDVSRQLGRPHQFGLEAIPRDPGVDGGWPQAPHHRGPLMGQQAHVARWQPVDASQPDRDDGLGQILAVELHAATQACGPVRIPSTGASAGLVMSGRFTCLSRGGGRPGHQVRFGDRRPPDGAQVSSRPGGSPSDLDKPTAPRLVQQAVHHWWRSPRPPPCPAAARRAQHRSPARKQTLRPVNRARHGVQANPVIRPSARSLEPGFTLASKGQDKDRIDV